MIKSCLLCLTIIGSVQVGANDSSEVLRGKLIVGHEVRSLQPCFDHKAYWLVFSTGIRDKIRESYDKLAMTKSYAPLYAEVTGVLNSGQSDAELAVDYDGTIEVESVILLEKWDSSHCNKATNRSTRFQSHMDQRTYVLECEDGSRYVARVEGETLWFFSPSKTTPLPRKKAEENEIYSDGKISVHLGSNGYFVSLTASLAGSGDSCTNNRKAAIWEHAKLNGAAFRATGNEPGWSLEIYPNLKIVLVAAYGQEKFEFGYVEPEIDLVNRVSVWRTGDLTLTVQGEKCLDSMSGDDFESRVTVQLARRQLQGCGKALH